MSCLPSSLHIKLETRGIIKVLLLYLNNRLSYPHAYISMHTQAYTRLWSECHFCLGVQKSLSKWSLSILLCLSHPLLFQYILLAPDDRNIPKLLHISKICCTLNKSQKENVDRLCIRPIKFKPKKKLWAWVKGAISKKTVGLHAKDFWHRTYSSFRQSVGD